MRPYAVSPGGLAARASASLKSESCPRLPLRRNLLLRPAGAAPAAPALAAPALAVLLLVVLRFALGGSLLLRVIFRRGGLLRGVTCHGGDSYLLGDLIGHLAGQGGR